MFPSHWEILVIFLVVLLLFGAKRIPEMAKGMGKGKKDATAGANAPGAAAVERAETKVPKTRAERQRAPPRTTYAETPQRECTTCGSKTHGAEACNRRARG